MNEKFLSRGKREDTGKWVEGYYVELPKEQHGEQLYLIIGLDGQYNRIIPGTAERCASLTDKNGTKIFEGDILPVYENGEEYLYKVIYECDCFMLAMLDSEQGSYPISRLNQYMREVVGNIYDNYELLKGGE